MNTTTLSFPVFSRTLFEGQTIEYEIKSKEEEAEITVWKRTGENTLRIEKSVSITLYNDDNKKYPTVAIHVADREDERTFLHTQISMWLFESDVIFIKRQLERVRDMKKDYDSLDELTYLLDTLSRELKWRIIIQ